MSNNKLSVETRLMNKIFTCDAEDINYLGNLIERFEIEYKYDYVNELFEMILEHKAIYIESYPLKSLIFFTVSKFAELYLEEKCNFEDVQHHGFFGDIVEDLGDHFLRKGSSELILDSCGYRHDYDMNLESWDGFVEALRIFTKKD